MPVVCFARPKGLAQSIDVSLTSSLPSDVGQRRDCRRLRDSARSLCVRCCNLVGVLGISRDANRGCRGWLSSADDATRSLWAAGGRWADRRGVETNSDRLG